MSAHMIMTHKWHLTNCQFEFVSISTKQDDITRLKAWTTPGGIPRAKSSDFLRWNIAQGWTERFINHLKKYVNPIHNIFCSYSFRIYIYVIYICILWSIYIDNEINHVLCIDFSTVTELIDLRISHRIPSLLGDVVGIILLTCGMTSGWQNQETMFLSKDEQITSNCCI